MTSRLKTLLYPIVAAALLLAGCSEDNGEARALDALATELAAGQAGDAADPALMAALHDPIMTDPLLATRANADAVRPATQPLSGGIPRDDVAAGSLREVGGLSKAPDPIAAEDDCPQCVASAKAMTLSALAAAQPGANSPRCAATLSYSAAWTLRLPAGAESFPDSRVIEAAGSDAPGCGLRTASLYVAAPQSTLVDWYYTQAARAGYAASHRIDGDQHLLIATRTRDGAAITVYFNARESGTAIDLVTAGGA